MNLLQVIASNEWWEKLTLEQQRQYLHDHPHSHEHLGPEHYHSQPLMAEWDEDNARLYNYVTRGDSVRLYKYLDKELSDEDKEALQGVVDGTHGYHGSTKEAMKKVVMTALAFFAIGAGLTLHPALLLGAYAVLNLTGHSPGRWLYNQIHGTGKDPYKAVDKAFRDQPIEFKKYSDKHLNQHLDEMEH